MSYEDRLRQYEQTKAKLIQLNLTDREYQQAIRKLANKYKI